jgi:hypothetical protein
VVVLVGATLAEPDKASAVALTLGVMLTDVAFVLVHASVDVPPALIVVGLAARVTVGAGPTGATVTGTEDDAVPPAPVAVIV